MVPVPSVLLSSNRLSEEHCGASITLQASKDRMTPGKTLEDGGLYGIEAKDMSSQDWLTHVQNPINWSPLREWMIILLLVITITIV